MTVPYENATSGTKTREEIVKVLQRFGCESVGFMDDFAEKTILLAFTHRGRQINLRASAKGWAAMYLKEHPHNWSRSKLSKAEHDQRAMNQGLIAINSILRDWVKGQVTAVECGIMSFEAVFVGHMLTNNGQPLFERLQSLDVLPPAIEGPRP